VKQLSRNKGTLNGEKLNKILENYRLNQFCGCLYGARRELQYGNKNTGNMIMGKNIQVASETYTDKKEKKIFLLYKEIQKGCGYKVIYCIRKGFLI